MAEGTNDIPAGFVKAQVDNIKNANRVFSGRNVNQQEVTLDTGNSGNWQIGLLICNINFVGNGVFAVSFAGSSTATIESLYSTGNHSVSARISNGKIILKSNNTATNTFCHYTYIAN